MGKTNSEYAHAHKFKGGHPWPFGLILKDSVGELA